LSNVFFQGSLYDLPLASHVLLWALIIIFFYYEGKVGEFNSVPYKVIFNYEIDSKEREVLEKKLASKKNIDLKCTISGGAQTKKTNSFSISAQESSKMNLEEDLFGGADSKFVTRNQLAKLANLVQSNFRVLEEYQIPEEKFSDDFIDTIIQKSGEEMRNVDFREALASLSTFATDFKGDLNADRIYNEISKVFTVEKSGDMKHIVVRKNEDRAGSKENTNSNSVSATAGFAGVTFGGAVESAKSNRDTWSNSKASVDDQLRDLNSHKENQIEFQLQGDKIVPKSLKVCKLYATDFRKDLTFERIKNIYYESNLVKKITVTTRGEITRKLFEKFLMKTN